MTDKLETNQGKLETYLLAERFFPCLFKYWEVSQLWKWSHFWKWLLSPEGGSENSHCNFKWFFFFFPKKYLTNLAPESVPPSCPQIKKREERDTGTARLFLWHKFYCVGFSTLTGYKSLLKADTACQWADQCPWLGFILRLLVKGSVFVGFFLHFDWVITRENFLKGECPPRTTSIGKGVQVIPVQRYVALTSFVVSLLGLNTRLRLIHASRSFPGS